MNLCEKCPTPVRCVRRTKCFDNRLPVASIVLAKPEPMAVKTTTGEGVTSIKEKVMNYTKKKPAKKQATKKKKQLSGQ